METYDISPPQMRSVRMPYQIEALGKEDCQHALLENSWQERVNVQDGIVFITYTCKHCRRQICQSLDEVIPPAAWNGARG